MTWDHDLLPSRHNKLSCLNWMLCPSTIICYCYCYSEFSLSCTTIWHPMDCSLPGSPRTVASQAPPSMGFSRQEYWSGLPFPSPGDLPNPGIKPTSPALARKRSLIFSCLPPSVVLSWTHPWEIKSKLSDISLYLKPTIGKSCVRIKHYSLCWILFKNVAVPLASILLPLTSFLIWKMEIIPECPMTQWEKRSFGSSGRRIPMPPLSTLCRW